MSGRFNSATIVGGVLFLFGLFAGYFSLQIPADADGDTGARTFPLMGAAAVLLMGALETRRGIQGNAPPLALSDRPVSIIGLMVVAIAYVWLITKLGYLLSTGIAAPLAMWMFGMRNPLALLASAILCPAIYHLIFFELLGVFPPYGEWFDLLDILQGG
ncbi:MAG: tripartite tricarboxylate transporter TctB family protein [Boseongicola sp.]